MDEKIIENAMRVFFRDSHIMPSQPGPNNQTRIGTLRWLLRDASFKATFSNLQMTLSKLHPSKLRCFLSNSDYHTKIGLQTVQMNMLKMASFELKKCQQQYADQIKLIVNIEDRILNLQKEIRALKKSI